MLTAVIKQDNGLFRAVSTEKEAFGKSLGEAIDNLLLQFENRDQETIYLVCRSETNEIETTSADLVKSLCETNS